jgi:hypothetical protein
LLLLTPAIVSVNSAEIGDFEAFLQGGTYRGDCRNLSMGYP